MVLNISNDLQDKKASTGISNTALGRVHDPSRRTAGREEELDPVIEALAAAGTAGDRIAGRGARWGRCAKEEIVKLGDRIGAILATSLLNKDWLAGTPYEVGVAGAFATAPAEELAGRRAFVLGVGAELGFYTFEGGLLFPSANVARIDTQACARTSIGILPPASMSAAMPSGRSTAINEALEKKQVRNTGYRTARERKKMMEKVSPRCLPAPTVQRSRSARAGRATSPRRPAAQLAADHRRRPLPLLPRRCTPRCRRVANCTSLFQFRRDRPGTCRMAIGLGVGNPGRPHVLIEGDGSLLDEHAGLDTVHALQAADVHR